MSIEHGDVIKNIKDQIKLQIENNEAFLRKTQDNIYGRVYPPTYSTPRYRVGSIVTYLEDGKYHMGVVEYAICLDYAKESTAVAETIWRYKISTAASEVKESMIKEIII